MNSYAAGAIVLLLLLAGNTCAEICEQPRSIAYNTLEVTLKNGTMEAFGFEYVPGTFWKKDEDTYVGCPCMIHKCLQYCAGPDFKYYKWIFDQPHVSHFGYLNKHRNKVIKVEVKGWSTDDVFKDYYVIPDQGRFYEQLDPSKMTFEDLEQSCISYNGNDESIGFYYIYHADPIRTLMITCAAISLVCFVILLVAFIITQELKCNQGKCIFIISFCLMVTFTKVLIILLSFMKPGTKQCHALAYIECFTFMGAAFWLNVMGFDLHRSFSLSENETKNEAKRFLRYSLYAWSMPLLMTAGLVANIHFYEPEDSTFKVELRGQTCSLNFSYNYKFKSAVIFEFGPQLVLLLANFAFLFLSLCKIRQQPGSNLEESSTSNTTNKNKFYTYLKLLAIMVGVFIMQIIFWKHQKLHGYWMILGAYFFLTGLWILIACVFLNARVRSRLLERLHLCHQRFRGTAAFTRTRNLSDCSCEDQVSIIEMANQRGLFPGAVLE